MIANKIPAATKTSFISFKSFIFLSQKPQKYYTHLLNFNNPFPLPNLLEEKLTKYPELYQIPGEDYAWKYLHSFCNERGKKYSYHISKPTESRKSCGRISPYLAWGNLSIKQAAQFVKSHSNYNSKSQINPHTTSTLYRRYSNCNNSQNKN